MPSSKLAREAKAPSSARPPVLLFSGCITGVREPVTRVTNRRKLLPLMRHRLRTLATSAPTYEASRAG